MKVFVLCALFLVVSCEIHRNALVSFDGIELEKVDFTKLVKLVPNEFMTFYKNMSVAEKMYLMAAGMELQNKIKEDGKLTYDDVINELQKMDGSLVGKFEALWATLAAKESLLTDGAKEVFNEYAQFHFVILEGIKSETLTTASLNIDELRTKVFNLAQAYINLTDVDRNSFGKALPTLSNFFNNPLYLNSIKKIKIDSSIQDYISIRNEIVKNFLKGTFSLA
uniref:Lipoprotein n=1 Tax=Rhabditophanes sp. KR3021 TaxID=114890 RepID=A0AC35TJ59_9BILA